MSHDSVSWSSYFLLHPAEAHVVEDVLFQRTWRPVVGVIPSVAPRSSSTSGGLSSYFPSSSTPSLLTLLSPSLPHLNPSPSPPSSPNNSRRPLPKTKYPDLHTLPRLLLLFRLPFIFHQDRRPMPTSPRHLLLFSSLSIRVRQFDHHHFIRLLLRHIIILLLPLLC